MNEREGAGRRNFPSEETARREEQSWAKRPHEDLVRAFRGLIWRERQAILKEGGKTSSFTPAIMIRNELSTQTSINMGRPDKFDPQRAAFFQSIEDAWDVIAYEHYRWEQNGEPCHVTRHHAGDALSLRYQRSQALRDQRPETITLDSQQVKILDALAEAAGVPHQQGQTEIEIPEKLRYYARHRLSSEGKLIF